jgi:hypothetical protein
VSVSELEAMHVRGRFGDVTVGRFREFVVP